LIVERTLLALATAAAVIAAVAVSIVAAFFALYAVVEPHTGAAGAAAVVAFVAALLAALIAFVAARKMEGDRKQGPASAPGPDPGLAGVILNLVKDRPLLSAGAAVAVGVYALRNPALISAVVRAFVDQSGPRGRS
jgi:hypothetical protein